MALNEFEIKKKQTDIKLIDKNAINIILNIKFKHTITQTYVNVN